MTQRVSLRFVTEYAVQAIAEALNRFGVSADDCVAIGIGLKSGYLSSVMETTPSIKTAFEMPPLSETALPVLKRAERIFAATMQANESSPAEIIELTECIESLGNCANVLHVTDMAFALYEIGYLLGAQMQRPALRIATLLRDLADADSEDQLYSSLWYYATECARDSIEKSHEWLSAIDAVEAALLAHVCKPEHQAELYQRLASVLANEAGTPLEGLATVAAVQSPPHAISRLQRFVCARAVFRFLNDSGDGLEEGSEDWFQRAALRAQNLLDDLRLKLMGEIPLVNTGVTWHDLALEHRGLIAAVPLGSALVADPARTGDLLLELAHEITHVYCLLGPIGRAYRACRCGVLYLEGMLGSVQQGSSWPNAHQKLHDSDVAGALATVQVEVAWRGQILLSTWTPWLEGVALYLELLCDPKADPEEIMIPFRAIRSLIDYEPPARGASESLNHWQARYEKMVFTEFENFYSTVHSQNAQLRHLAYFSPAGKWSVYLPGYLLARSIVAAWEKTLGYRLAPVRAVKLLLAAIGQGSMPAIPPLDGPLETFAQECRDHMTSWMRSIAGLGRGTLSDYLRAQTLNDQKITHSWLTGRPQLIPPEEISDHLQRLRAAFDEPRDRIESFLFGPDASDARMQHGSAYKSLYFVINNLAHVLPVGRDEARVILGDDGSVTVCARTYAGIVRAGEGMQRDIEFPRYSIGSFRPRAPKAAQSLRHLLARRHTARVLVTRVIDFAESKELKAGRSYVYLGLGTEWQCILDGFIGEELGEQHAALTATMSSRINARDRAGDESTTTALLPFLIKRCKELKPDFGIDSFDFDFDVTAADSGICACAKAFGIGPDLADGLLRRIPGRDLNSIANYLFDSGFGLEPNDEATETPLGSYILDLTAHSGVTPFGGKV